MFHTHPSWQSLGAPVDTNQLPGDLPRLYEAAVGGVLFGGAFLLRPLTRVNTLMSVDEYNAPQLWKSLFPSPPVEWLFFAEDVFGGPFGIHVENGTYASFDPETGEAEVLASSAESFVEAVLDEDDVMTGHPLLSAWRDAGNEFWLGERLVPIQPFVMEGAFDITNLKAVNDVDGMRIRAGIAASIAGLADGTKVKLSVDGDS